jgi:superfamily I DNA/RNA helicase
MLEIQVAGAGAGKTYGLAEKVLEKLRESECQKKIFALTYTNAAKTKIESEVIRKNGSIPENVSIETVHSFLLNEIIFPFSSYVLGDKYSKSSIIYLGNDFKYQASKIKRLKDQNIIHAEKAYVVAKQILDKENSKINSKKKKLKVDKVISILNQCIESIFIDEAQDLDSDALRVFEVLGHSNIFVYMIGDPKQAIKWANDFTEFIKNSENIQSELVNVLEPNNVTRRVPRNILQHSNRFCYEEQFQESISDEVGSVKYIDRTYDKFETFMKKHISGESIVCIDKRCGEYSTGNDSKHSFPLSIEEKIKSSNHGKDEWGKIP